jgi:hypothetical protein
MSIEINEDFMSLGINGAEITAAVSVDHLWRVTGWPGPDPQRGNYGAHAR